MPNRLAHESSPYLLQHAHNPVDWYPWAREALEKSHKENKPIFLSVGYSTCYWCHVMERECFENESIAAQMNANFVNIKLDREQRPDIDQLYMTAVQIITRQGGWPMSVFLTPDLKPFYAGTYFPPTDRYGRPGFPKILAAVAEAFTNRRPDVEKSADQIVGMLRRLARPTRSSREIRIDADWIRDLIDRSLSDYDQANGGFGAAPKFPRETLLELLLTHLRDHPDPNRMAILTHSLKSMAHGGIRDHLGGGFHRYSTDAHWLVPHFEIMLYDNAMLLWVYAEAHRQTNDPEFALIARGIADFILREMTSDSGAFFTALDAEVDGQEGQNYLWTREEITHALTGKTNVEKFLHAYGLDQGPNFADPHHGDGTPNRNVLFLAEDGSPLTDPDLQKSREILYELRRNRKQPRLDNKILISWNALMIRALSHAGEILHEPKYSQAAEKCADFLLARAFPDPSVSQKVLPVSSPAESQFPNLSIELAPDAGGAPQHKLLDDYAFLIQALLSLPNRRRRAAELAKLMLDLFADPTGGLYFTPQNAPDLIVRQMIGTDSPLPSGNGIAAIALIHLGNFDAAASILSTFAAQLSDAGEGMSALVEAALPYIRARGPLIVPAATETIGPKPPSKLASELVELHPTWDGPILRVRCRVKNDYHLNPHHSPVEPTRLTISGAEPETIEYPPGQLTGDFEIRVTFPSPVTTPIQLHLRYQPCDSTSCLPPATHTVDLPRK